MADESRFQLDTIETPSVDEFERRYLKPGRPVLIKGLVSRWPAASLWTPELLVSRVGKNQVPVAVMPRPGDFAGAVRKKMALAEYVATLEKADEEPDNIYLGQVSLAKFFPELMGDVETPGFFPGEQPLTSVIYMGRRQFSQLHYHPRGSATLCQVYGRKRVWLYPPDQTPYLYKYPSFSANFNMSLTTSARPDPTEFPKFAKARAIELVTEPGDLLFIPIYWWHAIQNEELNIAAVFFWSRDARSRWLPPYGMRVPYFREVGRLVWRKVREFVSRLTGRAQT